MDSKDKGVSRQQAKRKTAEAIRLLNNLVKYKVGPSDIHGVGIIAMRNIRKGEKLNMDAIFHQFDVPYKDFSKLRADVAQHILERWPLVSQGSHFIYPDAKMSAFMNHSDNPNYDAEKDRATRNISKGEEITEDYRKIPGHVYIFPWLSVDKS